jgi:CRISPR/Cas system-associated exonuclease Cas4 (RecB family)
MRPVVKLHRIADWMRLDVTVRGSILEHIKLKARLEKYLEANATKPPLPPEGKWVECQKCNAKGWRLKTPRHCGIHPSQLPHPCMLKIYWEMEGKEQQERHSARTLLTFEIGHAVHDMFQGYGAGGAWGPIYEKEVRMTEGSHPLATELMIEGSADAENILVIDNIPDAPIFEVGIVHEYKTMNLENYKKLSRPKPEHKQQATIYAAVLDRPVVVYLYLCKNDSNMSDFPVEFDAATWAVMENKARILNSLYNNSTEPEPTPAYHCNQCSFLYDCPAGKAFHRPGARR